MVKPLPEELQVMPLTLRIMERSGLWGQNRRGRCRFWLLFSIGTVVILFPKAVLGIGSAQITAICKGLAELIYGASIYATAVVFAVKMKTFEKIVSGLDEIYRNVYQGENGVDYYDMIWRQNVKIGKFFKFWIYYCIYGPIAYCLPSVIVSHWRFWTDANPLIFELPMEQTFYGLQIRTNFVHYHIFVAISLVAYYVCALFTLIKVAVIFFTLKYSSLTYRLLNEKIRKFSKNTENKVEELKHLVELHRKCLGVTESIEEICQIPILVDFIACVMFWCLYLVYVSKKFDLNLLNVAIMFLLSLGQTFGYSYLGSELAEEAEAIGKAIYDLPWYEHSVELQRYYRLIVQRAQRPAEITGAKFFPVNLATYASVMQLSYSYYVVLNDALNKLLDSC